jgi:hypothetical protein
VCKSGRPRRAWPAAFPHFRLRRLSARLERLWHDLFRLVQSALRVLPKFRDQPFGDGTKSAEPSLRQTCSICSGIGCHNIKFVTPEHVGAANYRGADNRLSSADCVCPLVVQHVCVRQPRKHSLMDGTHRGHLHARLQTMGHRALPKYLVASNYADAARKVIAAMHAQVGELTVDENGMACGRSRAPPRHARPTR